MITGFGLSSVACRLLPSGPKRCVQVDMKRKIVYFFLSFARTVENYIELSKNYLIRELIMGALEERKNLAYFFSAVVPPICDLKEKIHNFTNF